MFLQISEPTTSAGVLGEAIDDTSSAVISLGDQSNDAFDVIDDKLDTNLQTTSDSWNTVIEFEIEKKEEKLKALDDRIAVLEADLADNDVSDQCLQIVEWGDCLAELSCIWCNDNSQCMVGDSYGPTYAICNSYADLTCPSVCSEYSSCDSCLGDEQCGWCSNGQFCLLGNPDDTGLCHGDHFYHKDSDQKHTCPPGAMLPNDYEIPEEEEEVEQEESVHEEQLPEDTLHDEQMAAEQAELDTLKATRDQIQGELDALQGSEEANESIVASSKTVTSEDITIEPVENVAEPAEQAAIQEQEEIYNYLAGEEEIAVDAVEQFVDDANGDTWDWRIMGFDKETDTSDQAMIRSRGENRQDSDVEQDPEMLDGDEEMAEKLEERDENFEEVKDDVLEDFEEQIESEQNEETAEPKNEPKYEPVHGETSAEPTWTQEEVPPSSITMNNARELEKEKAEDDKATVSY